MAVVTSARWSLPAVRSSVASLLTFAGLPLAIAACLAIGGFGFANGGYFPVSWGWGSIGLLALVAVVLVAGSSVELAALDRIFLGALAGLAGWISLSLIWTASVTQTVLEVERMLVYLAAGVAGVLLCRRATVLTLVLGVWLALAVICTYGLVTRLFPEEHTGLDQVAVDRLSEPVGYWNALGILAVMGLLLALGLAARGAPLVRCLGAGSTVIFALTLYFTYSRASWIALFVAFAVAVAVDRSRLQLITATLVVAPWGAVAIGIASTSDALTRHQESLVSEAARDGHGLAVIGIALAVGAALAVLHLDWLSSALSVPEGVRRVYVGTLLFCLAAVLIAVFGRYGFPPTLARKAYDAFRATNTEGNDLNQRLFSLSSNGRTETWHTAWQEARHHPVLGGGAGSYAAFWAQNRRIGLNVHDAHNLYVETLAELGPLGLALLLAVVGAPLAALRRAR